MDNYIRIRSRRNEGNTSRNVTQDTLLREILWKNVFGTILKLNLRSSSAKGKTKATSTGFRGKYPSSYLMFLNMQISEKGFVVGFRMEMCLNVKTKIMYVYLAKN